MRPFRDVLNMWNQYDDRELLEWKFLYECSMQKYPHSPHIEHSLQDLKAIYHLLQKRKML